MGYFEAYRARMERNHNELMALANKVLELDKTKTIKVFVNRNRSLNSGIVFIKDDQINTIQFSEVPYRWSGCGQTDHAGVDNVGMPFTVRDVMATFRPITTQKHTFNTCFKSVEEYLKWTSYLVEHTPEVKI